MEPLSLLVSAVMFLAHLDDASPAGRHGTLASWWLGPYTSAQPDYRVYFHHGSR